MVCIVGTDHSTFGHPARAYKKHRGGSMRATILPYGILLIKAPRAAVSMMAKGCIVA